MYAMTALALLGAGTWAVRTPHPFAGEPIVVAQIPPAEELVTSSTEPVSGNSTDIAQTTDPSEVEPPLEEEQQFAAEEDSAPGSGAEPGEGNRKRPMAVVEQPVAQDVYRQEAGLVVSPRRALTPAPAKGLVESSPLGQLPRVGGNGGKPSQVYARPASLNVIHSDSPKIAIVLGGMGLNTRLTAKAITELPADISLAFAPYGDNLQKQVDRARKEGHEVFLQVPLEPVGFPASNPGPRTLLTDAGSGENLESLYWHMSRFAGYVGLVNYMGGRFLSSPEALTPLMRETRKRGLLFVEDGSLPLTATLTVAKSSSAEFRKAHTVIDSDPSPKAIIAALQLLEQEAQTSGIAIGSGSGLEITIETLRDWASDAADRGIIIIPVSAAFKGRAG
jgi:polysaccharide deacetylase 2 family uncharacterized protein YibQ